MPASAADEPPPDDSLPVCVTVRISSEELPPPREPPLPPADLLDPPRLELFEAALEPPEEDLEALEPPRDDDEPLLAEPPFLATAVLVLVLAEANPLLEVPLLALFEEPPRPELLDADLETALEPPRDAPLLAPPRDDALFLEAPLEEPPRLELLLPDELLDALFDEDLPPPRELLVADFLVAAFFVDCAILMGFK